MHLSVNERCKFHLRRANFQRVDGPSFSCCQSAFMKYDRGFVSFLEPGDSAYMVSMAMGKNDKRNVPGVDPGFFDIFYKLFFLTMDAGIY